MPDFFSATDIWLTQSVGLLVGTIIDSGLGFDCISSSFREDARTTHYWGGSILNGKLDLLTREYACCVLEGNRELLNITVRSCRNAIYYLKVHVVYCDKFHSLCGITTE